jgi:DNA-binding GntR family transcriptional regulator
MRSLNRVQSLHAQTYQAIRTAILSGELEAGDRIVETQLAETFQVSRTPIREAIRQLQLEHLINADPGGALRVAKLSVEDAIHLYDCRIALEHMSVMEACQRITPEQLARLDLIVQQAEVELEHPSHKLTNFQLLHMDHQFHRLLAESSGNSWLMHLLDQVFDKMALLRIRTMQHNPGVLEIRKEHRFIYAAIADRDPQTATQAIREHLMASKERVVREVQELDASIDADTSQK